MGPPLGVMGPAVCRLLMGCTMHHLGPGMTASAWSFLHTQLIHAVGERDQKRGTHREVAPIVSLDCNGSLKERLALLWKHCTHLMREETVWEPVLPPWPMIRGTKNDSSTWDEIVDSKYSITPA